MKDENLSQISVILHGILKSWEGTLMVSWVSNCKLVLSMPGLKSWGHRTFTCYCHCQDCMSCAIGINTKTTFKIQ